MLHRFVAPLALLLGLAIGLTACGSIPQPFRSAEKNNGLLNLKASQALIVLPVQGVSPAFGVAIQKAMTLALSDSDLPASMANRPNGVNYALTGLVQENSRGGDQVRLDVVWSLSAPEGGPAGLYQQRALVPLNAWLSEDPAAVVQLVAEGAGAINNLMQDNPEIVRAQPKDDTATQGPRIALGGVTGAPGDGNDALAAAMARALRGVGVTVTPNSTEADFLLTGVVAVTAPQGGAKNKTQQISINWSVTGRGGKNAGATNQNNTIPAGSLDGTWGAIAGHAAAAVAPGIKQILDDTAIAKRDAGDRSFQTESTQTASLAPTAPLSIKTPQQAGSYREDSAQAERPRAIATQPRANAQQQVAALSPVRSAAAGLKAWQVQFAASRNAQDAERHWAGLMARNSDLLGAYGPNFQVADIPGKGTYHRVRTGPFPTKTDARALCQAMKARATDCIVIAPGR
ncbi:MAG: SPOR domain-containing protein [Rhodospirillales bacterium]